MIKKSSAFQSIESKIRTLFGPSGESRTHGLLNPIQIFITQKPLMYQRFLGLSRKKCSGFCSDFWIMLNCVVLVLVAAI